MNISRRCSNVRPLQKFAVSLCAVVSAVALAAPQAASADVGIPGDSVSFGTTPLFDFTADALWDNAYIGPDGPGTVEIKTSQGLPDGGGDGTLSFSTPAWRPCPPYDAITVSATISNATVIQANPVDVHADASPKFSVNCSGVTRSFPYHIFADVKADTPDTAIVQTRPPQINHVVRTTGSGGTSVLGFDWETTDCDVVTGSTFSTYCASDRGADYYSQIVTQVDGLG